MKGKVKQMVESGGESDPEVIAAHEEWQSLDRALQSQYANTSPIGIGGVTLMSDETSRQMEEDRQKVQKAKEHYYELKRRRSDH